MTFPVGGLTYEPVGPDDYPRVEIWPDPRISTHWPGWLTADPDWRDHLTAMTLDDCRWFEHQWTVASGAPAAVDTSWVSMETIGGDPPTWLVVAFVVVLAALTVIPAVVFL